jgi:hypothetical protein
MSLLTGLPDSTGGCKSPLVDKVGVSLSQYHHTMVHIANHTGMNNRPIEAAVLRRQSHPIIANLPINQSYATLYSQLCCYSRECATNKPKFIKLYEDIILCTDVSATQYHHRMLYSLINIFIT